MGLAKALLRIEVTDVPHITRAVPAELLTDVTVSWSKGTYTLTAPSSGVFDSSSVAIATPRGTSALQAGVISDPPFIRVIFKDDLGATHETPFTIVFF